MGMNDREKIIKGLEYCQSACVPDDCECCPFGECSNAPHTLRITPEVHDAILSMLKAQRARVMTLEEVQLYDNSLTLEIRNAEEDEYNGLHTALHVAELDFNNPPCEVFGISGFEHTELLRDDTYGVDWRCWTARPTDAQREAEPWEA